MKISREWLQGYFEEVLPDAETLADGLTFHVFEIDGIERTDGDAVLDVKVTPNRGHDCLCHRGIAKELSAILRVPLRDDPFTQEPDLSEKTNAVSVSIETDLCTRYIAGYIRGVEVKPSAPWLRARLEAIGQRSINNVVDATNYVMFSIGQPLHAFDAAKLEQKSGRYAIAVRAARAREKLLALDEKEYTLSEWMLVIADPNKDEEVGIAGIKGGMPAGITRATQDIIIESANFDGPTTRKSAAALKLRTDASQRFEQVISPKLAAYGMRAAVDLILELAGGQFMGFTDVYPNPQAGVRQVNVTGVKVRQVLGGTFGESEIRDSFGRLGF